jgi:hypothetical protein
MPAAPPNLLSSRPLRVKNHYVSAWGERRPSAGFACSPLPPSPVFLPPGRPKPLLAASSRPKNRLGGRSGGLGSPGKSSSPSGGTKGGVGQRGF